MGDLLDAETRDAAERLKERVQRLFRHSLHIRHVDAGSCNACESEIKLLLNPYYDIQRLGIFFTTSPRHADLLLVTGPVTRFIPGCPPSPLTLIHGLLLALGRAEQRMKGRVQRMRSSRPLQMLSPSVGEKERY